MKKTLVIALLGTCASMTAFGQGHVQISNYNVAPYNAVRWDDGSKVGEAISLQLYWAAGNVSSQAQFDADKTAGIIFAVNPALTYFDTAAPGDQGGYFFPLLFQGGLTPGGPVTFQYGAFGPSSRGEIDAVGSRSVLWVETGSIVSTSLPANQMSQVPGLVVVVPEPSTFALAGLGAAALLIFRRRA
jgi:hypothetical protein